MNDSLWTNIIGGRGNPLNLNNFLILNVYNFMKLFWCYRTGTSVIFKGFFFYLFFSQRVKEQNYPEHHKISTVWEYVCKQRVRRMHTYITQNMSVKLKMSPSRNTKTYLVKPLVSMLQKKKPISWMCDWQETVTLILVKTTVVLRLSLSLESRASTGKATSPTGFSMYFCSFCCSCVEPPLIVLYWLIRKHKFF